MGGVGQLHRPVTIGTIPDDVLLNIFKSFVNEVYFHHTASEEWRILVHVCRRWRNLAFTSPRHLKLQLNFEPLRKSVKKMLDTWPELLICIRNYSYTSNEATDDIAAALRLNHRVSRIHLEKTSDSAWETFAALMQHPFPALTHLRVSPHRTIKNEISHSFLGGSAPCLQDLHLIRLPFPALPKLLLSSTNLVRLWHNDIPPSGYIPPQAMVTGLSALNRLESLSLGFQTPQSLPDREIQIPPPHTRTLLPALTSLFFQGVPEYIEDLVAQIDAPSLETMVISLFYQEVVEASELAKFVCRADKLSLLDRAGVTFGSDHISVTLSQKSLIGRVDPKTLLLNPTYLRSSALQLSYLVPFCASLWPTLFPFECLHIQVPPHYSWRWQVVVDDPDPRWLNLLHLFNTVAVKDLRLCKSVALPVARALRGLPAERVTEVLPALENVFISEPEPFGPVKEAISEFADARQLSGHPVSIYNWESFILEKKGMDRGVDR